MTVIDMRNFFHDCDVELKLTMKSFTMQKKR